MSQLHSHIRMLADKVRVDAYRRAISRIVKRDDIVVDIGAGTGIMSFFALQAGAKKVYAIESRTIIEVAKKTAKANSLNDRIEFIMKDSREAEIPQRADVIVTETIGSLGIDEDIVDIIAHGRRNFLKPDGRIIPAGLSIMAVPVSIKGSHPFHFLEKESFGFDFSHLSSLAKNNTYNLQVTPTDHPVLLSQAKNIHELDLYNCDPVKYPLKMSADFHITQEGTFHGMLVFPEIILTKDINISFLIEDIFQTTHWGVTFFPLTETMELSKGDIVSFDLTFSEGNGLIWRNRIDQNGEIKVFSQLSTFGLPTLKHLLNSK